MDEILKAIALPIVGWAWFVERRLSQLLRLKEDVQEANGKLDKLMWHLVTSKEDQPDAR